MTPELFGAAAYFTALLLTLEWFRRHLRVSADITRKLFLMGTGSYALVSVFRVNDATTAALPFIALAGLMYLSFRFEIFDAVEDDGASLGSVLMPLSCALLLWWFWGERAHIAVAGIFAVGFGDSFAALVGKRLGTRKYRTLGHSRSMEGTLALFLVSGIAMALVLMSVGGLDVHQATAFALISATVAASVESVSVYGTDNLTVPLATAGTLATLIRFSQ
jgi:phytol kinase